MIISYLFDRIEIHIHVTFDIEEKKTIFLSLYIFSSSYDTSFESQLDFLGFII